ncbi:hypothetical protein CANCADRAFT_32441 [Tortispora caseinolytica NRRL Y-17796]|uniref:Pre-mRNA-splicing factor CLF1 n=1 Tax=Tortispora caseinolytica NRRL Y-17796 TaxID=767744 RepID=A0A1E4TBC5_9ASCO|nr:hypothetical protein CANCADRAFT_32441 [Tortispora caseinolytica NRRL Y-17796]
MSGSSAVRNKAPAPVQISSEQILAEAQALRQERKKNVILDVADLEELSEVQRHKREEYEGALQRKSHDIKQWIRYAEWEVEQKEFARARSIFERALSLHPYDVPLRLRYIRSELKHENINHARNLLEQSVVLLPTIEKIWYEYVQVEEKLGNIPKCRELFSRWAKFATNPKPMLSWIDMECRYKEWANAHVIFESLCQAFPQPENWLKWAKFENAHGSLKSTRHVYINAIDTTTQMGNLDETLFTEFARWEASVDELERARAIYKHGLQVLPPDHTYRLYTAYATFEKLHGSPEDLTNVITVERKSAYENILNSDPKNYSTWIAYLQMAVGYFSAERVRAIFDRAVSQIPEQKDKIVWKEFVYLFIYYALWEEVANEDIEKADKIYTDCLNLIPHKSFTVAKVWLLYAKLLIRRGLLPEARKLLGKSIGMCPKPRLFKGYIDLELNLREFQRCRILYEKYCQKFSTTPEPFIAFANMEQNLGEDERARAIFEIALNIPEMSKRGDLWASYIQFEIEEAEYGRVRTLYGRYIEDIRTYEPWVALVQFELVAPDPEGENVEQVNTDYEEDEAMEFSERPATESGIIRARKVFERAIIHFSKSSQVNDRVAILAAWKEFEEIYGTHDTLQKAISLQPQMVVKQRKVGENVFEEYEEYDFPEDKIAQEANVNFLKAAHSWKEKTQN